MKQSGNDISVLDCTIRDGSYVIDYQFTAEDIYIICLGLGKAGFKLIEVGHGTGLGSSREGKGKAAATDVEYLKAAGSALKGTAAQFGMFFIPGIGKMEDLEMAADYGMGFVRIGTNVTEIEQAKPFIEKAKSLGMTVSSNFMKSYAVDMDQFIRFAKMADEFGADIISVVDSAGGMLPADVKELVLRLKDVTDKEIGFHGHNNLQLAIANTLEAVRSGATVVDSSLQGMGRSAGNAQTEVLVMVLDKLGYRTGIDPYKAMDMGERIIKPMMREKRGVDDISLVSGIAKFHSSFSEIIYNAARKYRIDPRLLILKVSEVDRVHVTTELAEQTALQIAQEKGQKTFQYADIEVNTDVVKKMEYEDPIEQAKSIGDEITGLSKKTGKDSIFSITISQDGQTAFPFIRQSSSLVIANVETSNLKEASDIVRALDGTVHWLVLDESSEQLRESGLERTISRSSHAWYSEKRILNFNISAMLSQKRPKKKVLILSDKNDGDLIKLVLQQQGISATFFEQFKGNGQDAFDEISDILSFGLPYANALTAEHVSVLLQDTNIYAARARAFLQSFWDAAIERGLFTCRLDSRAALAAELNLVIETKKIINAMGSTSMSGIPLVAGGVIGQRGSVVVDSLENPTRVIGIADGSGGLLNAKDAMSHKEAKEKIEEQLIKNLYRVEY